MSLRMDQVPYTVKSTTYLKSVRLCENDYRGKDTMWYIWLSEKFPPIGADSFQNVFKIVRNSQKKYGIEYYHLQILLATSIT